MFGVAKGETSGRTGRSFPARIGQVGICCEMLGLAATDGAGDGALESAGHMYAWAITCTPA